MTSETLRGVLKAQPFIAFRIHMGGGRSLDVLHPELLSMSPTGRIAVLFTPNDGIEHIDVFMVQSIEMLPPPKPPRSGRRRNGRH